MGKANTNNSLLIDSNMNVPRLSRPDSPPSNEAPVVAHFAGCYVHGSQNWIHTQVKYLRKHTPIVLTGQTKNLDQLDQVPPYYKTLGRPLPVRGFDRIGKALLGYRPTFRWQLHRWNATLIHAHFGPKGYKALPLAESHGAPLITTFYGYDLSRLPNEEPEWRDRYRTLFERGAHFLTEGHHMKKRLTEFGCPAEKITVQHLGVEVDNLPFQPRSRSEEKPLRVLAAGRFTEKKGFPDAIRAFALFLKRGGSGTLTIIGGRRDPEKDKEARQKLQRIVDDHGIGDHVHFLDFLPHDELIEAYLDHHVLLSPSIEAANGDNEGGAPVTLIEASATGMPIVSTWHCDIPEVVQHEETGLLAEEEDTETLTRHLHTLWKDPDQLRTMGVAAHKHIEGEYAAKKQGKRLDSIYKAVQR